MMQVYLNALTASEKGPTQYVLQRSLDLFCTHDKDLALRHLVDGWDIKAVCVNGVMERTWKLHPMLANDDESENAKAAMNNAVYQRIAMLLNLPIQQCITIIHTREFFDSAGTCDTIYMYLDILKPDMRRPGAVCDFETVWVTPEDRIANPQAFETGQEKAGLVIDILTDYGIKQDKEHLLTTPTTHVVGFKGAGTPAQRTSQKLASLRMPFKH